MAVENMLGPYDLFRSPEEGRRLLDDVEGIGFCLDTGHANLTSSLKAFSSKLPNIRHIHIHDNGGTRDDHLAAGRGILDWNGFIKQLGKNGFKGWIVAENYELSDALETLRHEFIEYVLTIELIAPYKRLINKLIVAFEEEMYLTINRVPSE